MVKLTITLIIYYILPKHGWLWTLSVLLILVGGYYQLTHKVPLSLTLED